MDLFDDSIEVPLVIVGNGFDIHHGLKTSYHDFRNYLTSNVDRDFVRQLESFFQAEYYDSKVGKTQVFVVVKFRKGNR